LNGVQDVFKLYFQLGESSSIADFKPLLGNLNSYLLDNLISKGLKFGVNHLGMKFLPSKEI
jgi:hypothetical protein